MATELTKRLPRSTGPARDYRRVNIKQVDAFTETPQTGNPAGVVLNAGGLSDTQMQAIAREMALSETAYVLPASIPGADLKIRWFTPTDEVALCGHATVAAFHALASEGLHGMGSIGTYAFKLETKSGILPVNITKGLSGIDVFFGLPVPEFVRAPQFKLDLMRILNLKAEDIDPRLPIVSTDMLFVPVPRLHIMFSLAPNFHALSQLLENRNLTGVCVFTTETIERKSSVHSRFFAPNLGINEDPVTGSANGPLGVYLYEQGLVEPVGDTVIIIGEQGDEIGRKGRVTVQVKVKGAQVLSVTIGGRAVTVLDGEMLVA